MCVLVSLWRVFTSIVLCALVLRKQYVYTCASLYVLHKGRWLFNFATYVFRGVSREGRRQRNYAVTGGRRTDERTDVKHLLLVVDCARFIAVGVDV